MSENCIRGCGSLLESRSNLHSNSLSIKSPSESSNYQSGSVRSALSRSVLSRRVAQDHEQEWLNSGVDAQIIHLNVQTLSDNEVDHHRREMQYPIAEKLNWKVTRSGRRKALRGWWVSGIDPLNGWQQMLWGRFKPDAATPVMDRAKGKPAKYLSPSLGKGSSRLVLLDVPFRVWQRVADRYQMPIERHEKRAGFWSWVLDRQIPVVLTEGEKKAGCLLTAGYAAIALPGIFGGARREGNQLIPDLAIFAAKARDFLICFDYESRPLVVQQINFAIAKLGYLIPRSGVVSDSPEERSVPSTVSVVTLPGPEKGVDDFIMARDVAEFDRLASQAQEFANWQAARAWELTYEATEVVDRPYLESVNYPHSGFVCIKSPKGTGKTMALRSFLQEHRGDRKVLVLTHRIQLGRSICQSLGLPWIGQVKSDPKLEALGYGICVDSLHSRSQAKFDVEDWENAIVILDEVEQVIWHALNSITCVNSRVRILSTLKALIQTVLNSGGLVIAQDADLSDISIDYLLSMLDEPLEPWLLVNQWRNDRLADTYIYDTKNPAPLLLQMEKTIATGPVYLCLDSQKVKSRWGSRNLETYLIEKFPDKKILRIDSETVADFSHPAYGISKNVNAVVKQFDIVLATPTIGTGVSIDLTDHFVAVFGIFNGVTSDAESRQALARVRTQVPRYVWASHYGLGKIGNGSSYYREIVDSTTKGVKCNIALLREVDFDLDQGSDPVALRTWSRMAARVNLSLIHYRQEMRRALECEGHAITIVTDDPMKILGSTNYSVEAQYDLTMGNLEVKGYQYLSRYYNPEEIDHIYHMTTQIRQDNQKAEAIAVSGSIDDGESTTIGAESDQRLRQRNRELKSRYAVNVTPDLLLKDEQGWYAQLRLHYYLVHDPLFVRLRDRSMLEDQLQRGNGVLALQDVKLLTAQVEMLRALGMVALLNPERRIRTTDEDVQHMWATLLAHRKDVRMLFGINVTDRTAPMTAIQLILAKMNLRLVCVSRDRNLVNGCRGGLRVYQFMLPTDDRTAIFEQWKTQDELCLQAVS
jgi:Domain of unknown function (DUF3854)